MFYREHIPISPITSRYTFDFNNLMQNKQWFSDVDVMINDENTLTKNWNVFFKTIGIKVPIMSTNYFLDSPLANKVDEKIRYYERQMEEQERYRANQREEEQLMEKYRERVAEYNNRYK